VDPEEIKKLKGDKLPELAPHIEEKIQSLMVRI